MPGNREKNTRRYKNVGEDKSQVMKALEILKKHDQDYPEDLLRNRRNAFVRFLDWFLFHIGFRR